MGVDYTPRFGIGYKVQNEIFEDDTDMDSWLDGICGEKYKYIEIGDSAYTGRDNTYFVVLKDPFETIAGANLTEQQNELFDHLSKNKVKILGKFGVCGGLHVW